MAENVVCSIKSQKGFQYPTWQQNGVSRCLVNFGLIMTKMVEPSDSCASTKDNSNFKTQNGVTPLEEAVRAGQIDAMDILLETIMPKTIIGSLQGPLRYIPI